MTATTLARLLLVALLTLGLALAPPTAASAQAVDDGSAPASAPAEPAETYARMASIPHGTTINAQGTASTAAGPPTIPRVDITPSFSSNGQPVHFPSQIAAAQTPPQKPVVALCSLSGRAPDRRR